MTEKTKTIVVFESHERTIIRRSRRTVSGQVVEEALARTSGRASSDAPEPAVLEKPKGRWLAVALKGVNSFSRWSRQVKRGGNERRNKQP